jgi:hypothetical protein
LLRFWIPCREKEAAMPIELTEELRQALAAHPEAPLRLIDSQTNTSYVVVRSEDYDRLRAFLEEAEDAALQKAWLDMATKTRRAWVQENPY